MRLIIHTFQHKFQVMRMLGDQYYSTLVILVKHIPQICLLLALLSSLQNIRDRQEDIHFASARNGT